MLPFNMAKCFTLHFYSMSGHIPSTYTMKGTSIPFYDLLKKNLDIAIYLEVTITIKKKKNLISSFENVDG